MDLEAFQRSAGLLLHPTSLPGRGGIGSLGEAAFRWVDFLKAAGQRLWQVMPLGPTSYGDSPYQCFSAFAGNPLLIDLEALVAEGLLKAEALAKLPTFPEDRVDYGAVIPFKLGILREAHAHFECAASAEQRRAFAAFCEAEKGWLDDYALFMALKEAHGGRVWNAWDAPLRRRDAAALQKAAREHARSIERHKFWQWCFFEQWLALKRYANARAIRVIGDIPIFIAFDSADAWANPELYYFDEDGNPTVVAGVPPDYFSATGQRWGNPLYRWEVMAERGFDWWIARFRAALTLYDLVRIDHFRAFEAYWEIPAGEPTAASGRWVEGPGQAFFDALEDALGELPIIAEDLGLITPEVEALRDANDLPGMKVLQFAFGEDASHPYLPHNYPRNCVVYTGTHDNDTTRGWFESASERERDFVRRYLARGDEKVALELVRLACASVADLCIVPVQDVLDLGSEARMNTPGSAHGNWSWRLREAQLEPWVAPWLSELATLYGRLTPEVKEKSDED
jgi:4-alpha-glucanotransferase